MSNNTHELKIKDSEIFVYMIGHTRPKMSIFKTKTDSWVAYFGENEEPYAFLQTKEDAIEYALAQYPALRAIA